VGVGGGGLGGGGVGWGLGVVCRPLLGLFFFWVGGVFFVFFFRLFFFLFFFFFSLFFFFFFGGVGGGVGGGGGLREARSDFAFRARPLYSSEPTRQPQPFYFPPYRVEAKKRLAGAETVFSSTTRSF